MMQHGYHIYCRHCVDICRQICHSAMPATWLLYIADITYNIFDICDIGDIYPTGLANTKIFQHNVATYLPYTADIILTYVVNKTRQQDESLRTRSKQAADSSTFFSFHTKYDSHVANIVLTYINESLQTCTRKTANSCSTFFVGCVFFDMTAILQTLFGHALASVYNTTHGDTTILCN